MNARQLLLNLVIIIVVLAIGGAVAYESYEAHNYVSTDNAQVSMPVVEVAAPAAGTVGTVSASVGETVRAGQPLFTLVPAASAAQGASAAAPAGKKGAAAKAPSTATAAPQAVTVSSPVAGIVSAVSAAAGATALPGQSMVEVSEPADAVVVANVPETAIRNVADGQKVDVTLDAYPGTTFSGHVQAVQPATQASLSLFPTSALSGSFTKVTQLVPVWIAFNPEGDAMYNGLSAEVSIHIGSGGL